jgi:hypothetical protein
MAKVEIPGFLISHLGPEMKMGVHWVDIKLNDGNCITNLVVQGNRYLTGYFHDSNGTGDLPFTTEQIVNLRRRALLGQVWPFWPIVRALK